MLFANPKDIAEAGESIYKEKYRDDYEEKYPAQFVAIDVETKGAFVDILPEKAMEKGRKVNPVGLFHLMKIGASGAFRMSYVSDARSDWLF